MKIFLFILVIHLFFKPQGPNFPDLGEGKLNIGFNRSILLTPPKNEIEFQTKLSNQVIRMTIYPGKQFFLFFFIFYYYFFRIFGVFSECNRYGNFKEKHKRNGYFGVW